MLIWNRRTRAVMITSKYNTGSLLPLYLAVFVVVLGFSLVAPIFPHYAMNLGASYAMLGFIVSIYGAVQMITQVPIGRLSDRMGRKKILLLGLVTFAFLPLLYIYASNAYLLLLIRALGFFSAFAFIGQVAQRDSISFASGFSLYWCSLYEL